MYASMIVLEANQFLETRFKRSAACWEHTTPEMFTDTLTTTLRESYFNFVLRH